MKKGNFGLELLYWLVGCVALLWSGICGGFTSLSFGVGVYSLRQSNC